MIWRRARVHGSTSATLSLSNLQAAQAGNYTVQVNNGAGNVASTPATLTVTGPPATAPAITAQPLGQTVTVGGNVFFNVTATGTAPLAFQWAFNGTNLTDGPGIQGSTTATLTLSNVQAAQAGNYTVQVNNGAGPVTSTPAALIVNQPVPTDLATVLNNPNLTWTTTGDANWFGQTGVTHDGISAAQSGQIGDLQSSSMSTVVTGPATVSFWWKVDSEPNFDFLSVAVDGVTQAQISGPIDWNQQTITVPGAGMHIVTWTYAKDVSNSVGADAGWVDQVTVGP